MGRLHDGDPYVGNTATTYVINGRKISVIGWRDINLTEYEWFDLYEGDSLLNSKNPLINNTVPSFDAVRNFMQTLAE